MQISLNLAKPENKRSMKALSMVTFKCNSGKSAVRGNLISDGDKFLLRIISLTCLATLISMTQPDLDYRILATSECEKYIVGHGTSLEHFSLHYSIPSEAGLIYTLPNGEFVLVPSNAKPTYPGIIFRDRIAFKKYCDRDFFPIEEKDMTWLEAHAERMKHMNKDMSFFQIPLKRTFGAYLPAKSFEDLESLYKKVKVYVKNNKTSARNKEEAVYCYGLCVIEYLMRIKHYRLNLEMHHEIYNPYFEPIIVLPDKTPVDVLSSLFIAIRSNSEFSFDSFCRNIRL